jgi:hypothetical protein
VNKTIYLYSGFQTNYFFSLKRDLKTLKGDSEEKIGDTFEEIEIDILN